MDLLHTAIGVFNTRDEAEAAYKILLERHVPPQDIVYLTRSEVEDASVGKELSARVGGVMGLATGMTAGVGAAVLLAVPGIGQVVALGLGAAALLGLAGAGAGSALGKTGTDDSAVQPTPDHKCSEDVEFFRKVLAEGRSLVVVRSESLEVANVANGVLSRLGINMQEHVPIRMQTAKRQVADVAVLDVSGRITLGEGSALLRQQVREALEQGNKKIVFNLHEVGYIDSSGLGELVKSYTTVRSQGGQLKLVQISQRVHDLLHMTKLHLVLEIEPDEATAIQSFKAVNLANGSA
jgi:anti-sigma B factor antagonist